jgi:hypothetical protein
VPYREPDFEMQLIAQVMERAMRLYKATKELQPVMTDCKIMTPVGPYRLLAIPQGMTQEPRTPRTHHSRGPQSPEG